MKISDITEIIKTVGAILTTSLGIYLTYKLGKMHKEINGRMGELIEAKKEEGKREGIDENQAKTDAKNQKDK